MIEKYPCGNETMCDPCKGLGSTEAYIACTSVGEMRGSSDLDRVSVERTVVQVRGTLADSIDVSPLDCVADAVISTLEEPAATETTSQH